MMDTKVLREKVLDLAIRGKLVPQDPNDEPASVLLERIRQQKQQMVKEGKLKAKDIKNDTIIFVGEDNLHYEKFADGSVKCIEDEIPFELPEGWAWARLGAVAEAISDGDHQPPPQTSSGIPFLVISNVSGGVLSFENTRFVSVEYFNQLPETRKPRNGDLLFTVTGSYGIPVLVDTDDNFCFQRHIAMVRPCIISNRYLYIMLGSSYVKSICDNKATGIAQKTVGLSTLRELLVPIAPLSQQIKIYEQAQSALCVVDGISSDKEDLLKTINNAKAKILNLAIRGQLVPQDPADEPASVLLERIRAEKEELIKQGKIKRDKNLPETWCWCRLGTLFAHNTGKALNSSDSAGTPMTYITTSNLYWDRFELDSLKEMPFTDSEIEKCTVTKGDLLVCEGGDIGRSAIWMFDENIRIQNHIHRLRPYISLSSRFYYYVMYMWKQLGLIGGQGIGLQGFSSKALHNLIVPLPSIDEQGRMVDFVDELFETITSIEKGLS